jgi:hypothetical protein
MKKKNLVFVLFVLALATPSVFFAQLVQKGVDISYSAASVKESERLMSQGNKNAMTVDLPKTTAKFAEKMWKDYTKQFKGDTKRDRKTDEIFTDNAQIPAVGGSNTVDMYVKFAESGDMTTMTTWIDLGGAYVNSKDHADKYKETEKILQNFALTVAREQTTIQLKEQQDEMKSLEKQQRRLEEKNTDLHKDIENYKKKIQQAETDIQTNLKAQEETKLKMEAQKKVVEEVQKKLNALNK